MRLCATCALLLLLAALDCSEILQTAVRPDKGWTVMLSTKLDQCPVCTVSGVNDTQTTCQASLSLVPEEEVKLLFNCSQPIGQTYTVMINSSIECTKDSCDPSRVALPSVLTELSRTFSVEVKAPEKTVVSLDVLGEGLMESSQPCADGIQYSVVTSKTDGKSPTQYCRGGSETRLDLSNEAAVSLQVWPNVKVETASFQASAAPLKGRTMAVTVDPSTTVALIRDVEEPECEVCTVEGSTPSCSSKEKQLTSAENSLEFSCLKPEDVFSVKMKKKIACTESSCTPAAAEVDPELFKDFKRSLTWDVSVPEKTVLTLDFPAGGLKHISAEENCQDGYRYSVSTTKNDGKIKANSYCRGGALSHLDLLGATTVTAEVPKGGELDRTVFNVKAAPRGARMMSVTPDPETIIIISRVGEDPDCSVCVDDPPNQKCDPKYLRLTDHRNTSVEFTCPRPQDVFNVEINREIDCTETSCSGNIVQPESSLFPDFNRTFTWDLKVVATRAFQLDFPEPGMRQIPNEETCPDAHTYSLVIYLRTGPANIGTFCKGGTVTTIMARYKGRVSLQVPGEAKLDPVDFKLHVGPETDKLAIVKVNLPRGVSDIDFITANYPGDFPDVQQMQWDFTVPGMHNYSVSFLSHAAPECLSGEVMVEYQKKDKKVTKATLTDPQPKHQQGNFNMVLKNCETNRTLEGLNLKYRVSVMRSGHPVLCTVDLTKHREVSVQIEKVGSDPNCEISMNSKVSEKIDVAAGTTANLSFLDCPKEDIRLTASKVIWCRDASCSASKLTVPKLDSCLPMPLHSFTWNLYIPKDRTLDLVSPTGSLKQSLPGQRCNHSVLLHVAEGDGSSLGDFCFNGDIQKVQVHANVSVTATVKDFNITRGPFLSVNVSQEIPETVIYRVSPKLASPTLLATPGWPGGMNPSTTVSWIVTLPSQYQAHLQFVNITRPKCKDRHAYMKVKTLDSVEEMMSRREDEEAEDKLLVLQSFYLNMSNCIPEERQFSVLTKITLEKKTNLLAIVLGITGAVVLALAVLGVVCCITKKKKKQKMNTESSIYISKGNIFRPGDRHFSKTRSDNESHVYDSIDETMVYGHLLGDSYQTFTGPVDGSLPTVKEPDPEPEMDQYNTFLKPSETFIPPRPRTPIDRQDSLGFQDRRMVDNELYTFKSTGEINTIRLSGVDMEPQPPITEESL
ncbi:CUB domain-containing protein 1 [Acanthochromis polyacanthus]|uniref:CUB domain-containing protein 1 n=1 Tax=Acanthochromis polyacanthus TaxID=80966 RepID=UPI002233F6C4|nr:CUB domain-containing protein 1 [Acanthochromis polyacanthus]